MSENQRAEATNTAAPYISTKIQKTYMFDLLINILPRDNGNKEDSLLVGGVVDLQQDHQLRQSA